MTIQELIQKYNFHDSSVTNITYSADIQTLEILIEFCYWAQEWYKKGDPELMEIKLMFEGIESYDGLTGDIDYYSILDGDIRNELLHFLIADEFHGEYFEYYFSPSNIDVEILRKYDD